MKFRPFCSDQFKKVCTKIEPSADQPRRCAMCETSVTQQLLCSKSHDFLAIFAVVHSKINQIA